MDLKRLTELAKLQRAAEDEPIIGGYQPPVSAEPAPAVSVLPAADEIFVPMEDEEEPYELPDDGYSEISSTEEELSEPDAQLGQPETLDRIISKCFTDNKAYNIEVDRLLPFRSPIFTHIGDISELKSDIVRKGITEPLLVRSAGNGEYEILSGNRRRAAAEQLMWTKVPCYIGSSDLISDEYAIRIVVDSNRDRFSELSPAEKIRVAGVLGRNSAAGDLRLTNEQEELFIRLNALEQYFLDLLDSGSINMATAELIAEMSVEKQSNIPSHFAMFSQ